MGLLSSPRRNAGAGGEGVHSWSLLLQCLKILIQSRVVGVDSLQGIVSPHSQLALVLGRGGRTLAIVLYWIRRCVTTTRNLQSATNIASFCDLLHGSKDSTYLDFGFEFDRHSVGIV